jgi:leucyl aminopeptidase
VLLVGLGKRDAFDPGAAYAAGLAASKKLAGRPRDAVLAVTPIGRTTTPVLSNWAMGLLVGLRGPGVAKSQAARHEFRLLRVLIPDSLLSGSESERVVSRIHETAAAVVRAREWANLPPNEKPPRLLADRIASEARAAGLNAEIWDRPRIEAEQFGGLLGVSAGSAEEPRFLVLTYTGDSGPGAGHTALVGKGVTFDSGGLSIKPSASMEDMKVDMTGAAVVASSLIAAARLELPAAMRGYLPLAENMTGGAAMKLGDVLRMRNGITVEVMNTDAEGRLILADALAYSAEGEPERIIDLATLTGACMVGLGTRVAGLFSNAEELARDIGEAASTTGERVWRLPLDGDYSEGLKSKVADCKNVAGKWGGAITAAKFLEKFVAGRPWAHLDIAGPSWAEDDSATVDAGATGCYVRTILELVTKMRIIT